MNTKPLVRFALGFITLLVALSASAQLQYYWDATNPITNSPGSGGAGNWSTSTADWWVSGSSDSVWANGNIANFAGTAGTVTLTGAVTANGLTFTTSGYTVGGSSTLTLAGPPIISLPGGTTAISCIIAGSSGLTTSGSGTLTLSGVNTYTGGTTNGSGCTLTIGGAGKLGSGSYSGGIANAGTFDWASSASQTLSGVVSGAGTLVQGGGTLTLTANNTFTGGMTINSTKTLTVSGNAKLGGGTYSANITNNGTFNFNATNSETLNGTISGNGALAVNPGGNLGNLLTLNGANTYSGSTTIAGAGQIIINSDSSLGTPPASFAANQLIFEYGFLKANGTFTLSATRGIDMLAGNQGIGASIQVNPNDTLTLAAPIAGAFGVIFGSGEPTFGFGTNLLANNSTYTGPTALSTGRLLLGVNGALPSGTTFIMAPDNVGGSFFDLGGFTQTIGPLSTTNTFYAPAGVGTGTPTIILSGALTVLQTNISTVFSGLITGSGGSLNINGNSSGTLILSNYANDYTGLTTINGGKLDISTAGSSIAGNVTVNGGTLELDNNAALATTATLTMAASITVNLNFSGTQTVAALFFGSTNQATGLWGAPGNPGATFTDSRFTGSGLILVCPAPDQTITPAIASVCAGATTTASVTVTPGATYSWSVNNGTVISGATSSTLTYSAWADSPVTLNCVVTSPCGVQSAGGQNTPVTVNICGPIVQAENNVVYDKVNGATITGRGVMGANWLLNASTNANAPMPWPTIQNGTVTSSPFTVNDPNAINFPQQFYYLTNSP
jgi:fibronectin-binding autotransporter adhesin